MLDHSVIISMLVLNCGKKGFTGIECILGKSQRALLCIH